MADISRTSSFSILHEDYADLNETDTSISELELANCLLREGLDELRRANEILQQGYDSLQSSFDEMKLNYDLLRNHLEALQRTFEEQNKQLQEQAARNGNMERSMEDRISQLTEVPAIQEESSTSVGSAISSNVKRKIAVFNLRNRCEAESSKSESNIWNVNQKLSRSKAVKQVFASEASTLAFYDDGYDIFTHSPNSANLHTKKFYPHSFEAELIFWDISPDVKTLIYSQMSTVGVFDLCKARPVKEIPFDSEICRVTVNNNYFAVTVAEGKYYLYSVTRKSPIAEFARPNAYPRLLSNNILLFQEETNTILCLFNAKSRKRMESIGVGLELSDIGSNASGTIMAVHAHLNGLFKMFDVKSRQEIIEIETAGFGRLFPNSISDDARHVAFWANNQITILSLNTEENGRRTLNFGSDIALDEDVFYSSFLFRQIDGVNHFQYVTYGGILVLYILNAGDKCWNRLE